MEFMFITLPVIVFILLAICGILLYFIPTIIAFQRKHENKIIILLINLLLGWSFWGWIVALVWAFIDTDGTITKRLFKNNTNDKYDELERLHKLKEDGIISEEEFQNEKSKILK